MEDSKDVIKLFNDLSIINIYLVNIVFDEFFLVFYKVIFGMLC